MQRFFEKIGLKKKEPSHEKHAHESPAATASPLEFKEEPKVRKIGAKGWLEREKMRPVTPSHEVMI